MSKNGPEYNDIVVIYRPKQMIEAQMIIGVLESFGIEVLVQEYFDPYTGGLAGDKTLAGVWGEISVHQNDAVKASEIIKDYLDSL
jgi:uncharacterized protein YjfI (DUF2170 family)